MEQDKQAIIDYLLSQEGVKPTNEDFKILGKYYGFSMGDWSAFTARAKLLKLPDQLLESAKKYGYWSVYLGDVEGCGRNRLVRNMLIDSYFTEFLQYQELMKKETRVQYIKCMESELKNTQDSIDGFYNSYTKR